MTAVTFQVLEGVDRGRVFRNLPSQAHREARPQRLGLLG